MKLFLILIAGIIWMSLVVSFGGCSDDVSESSGADGDSDADSDSDTDSDADRDTDSDETLPLLLVDDCITYCTLQTECLESSYVPQYDCGEMCEVSVSYTNCEFSVRDVDGCSTADIAWQSCIFAVSTCEELASFTDGVTANPTGESPSDAYLCSIEYTLFQGECAEEYAVDDPELEALVAVECADEIAAIEALLASQ